jgi:2-methylfumaryl-CoA isomerase
VNHVFPAWDAIAGHQIALAILAAERHRSRTGPGQLVSLALKDVGLAMLGHLGFIAEAMARRGPRALRQLPVRRLRPRLRDGRWRARDGGGAHRCAVERCAPPRTAAMPWPRLAADRARPAHEGNRFAAREQIAALLAPWFAARPLAEVRDVLTRHRV